MHSNYLTCFVTLMSELVTLLQKIIYDSLPNTPGDILSYLALPVSEKTKEVTFVQLYKYAESYSFSDFQ